MTDAPKPEAFLQFWIIIGFIAAILVNVVTLVVSLSNRKQRREVNFAFEPASDAECRKRHEDSLREIERIEAEMKADRTERKINTGELHEKINDVAKRVSELQAETRLQNQQLARLDTKLDRIVEKKL